MTERWNYIQNFFKNESTVERKDLQWTKRLNELATFIPDQILKLTRKKYDEPQKFTAVLLHMEITGLSKILQSTLNDESYQTKLNHIFSLYYDVLLETIYYYKGDVMKMTDRNVEAVWTVQNGCYSYEIIHHVITCALVVQKIVKTIAKDILQRIFVKITISYGELSLIIIGNEYQKDFLLVGSAAEEIYREGGECGDVLLSKSAWSQLAEDEYQVDFTQNKQYIKVLQCLYKEFDQSIRQKYDEKEKYFLSFVASRIQYFNDETFQILPRNSFREPFKNNMIFENDLRSFIFNPALDLLENNDKILNEFRLVTIKTIKLNLTNKFHNRPFICNVSKVVLILIEEADGNLIRSSYNGRDLLFTILYGSNDSYYDQQSYNACKAAYKLMTNLSRMKEINSISIAIARGLIYCGVFGLTSNRKSYIISGSVVNKIMNLNKTLGITNEIICDYSTYFNCKLPGYIFKTTEIHLNFGYTFKKNLKKIKQNHLPTEKVLLGRNATVDLISLVIDVPEKVNGYQGVCLNGVQKSGKTHVIKTLLTNCLNDGIISVYLQLFEQNITPFYTICKIYEQLFNVLGFTGLGEKEKLKMKNVPRHLIDWESIIYKGENYNVQSMELYLKNVFKNLEIQYWVIFIDNVHLIDKFSLTVLLKLIQDDHKVRLVCAGNFDKPTWDVLWHFSNNPKIQIVDLVDMNEKYANLFICYVLKVSQIEKKLLEFIKRNTENIGGWLELYAMDLLNSGQIEIKRIDKDDVCKYDLCGESKNLQNCGDFTKTISIAVLNENFQMTKLSPLDLYLKTLNQFSEYERNLLRVSSVFGPLFYRAMLEMTLNQNGDKKLILTITDFFKRGIFACGTRYYNQIGCMSDDVICDCNLDIKSDYPKYSFCTLIYFKDSYLRETAYSTLSKDQRRFWHSKSMELLECFSDNIICSACIKCNNSSPNYMIDYLNNYLYFFKNQSLKDDSKTEVTSIESASSCGNITAAKCLPINCFCLQIMIKIFSDLVSHAYILKSEEKQMTSLIRYAALLLKLKDSKRCLETLRSAKSLQDKIDIPSFDKKFSTCQINILLATMYLEMSEYDKTSKCLHECLSFYSNTSQEDKGIFLNIFRHFKMSSQSIAHSNEFFDSKCLVQLFGIIGKLMHAKKYHQLSCFINSKALFFVNKFDLHSLTAVVLDVISANAVFGRFDVIQKAMTYFLYALQKSKSQAVENNYYGIFRLCCKYFDISACSSNSFNAIKIGYNLLDSIIFYNVINCMPEYLSVFASILLTKQRIEEAVSIAKILRDSVEYFDRQIILAYIAFCLELPLETGFYLDPINSIQKYAEIFFKDRNQSLKYTSIENKLIILLCLHCIRNRMIHKALYWKKLLDQQSIYTPANFIDMYSLLSYLQCSLLLLVRTQEIKLSTNQVQSKNIKNLLDLCKDQSKKWPFFMPRFLLMEAYYHRIKNNKRKCNKVLKVAAEVSKNQDNILDEIWMTLNRNAWNEGVSFSIYESRNIKWNYCKSYSPHQWAQLMYCLPF